jgi:hypothetical protein
MNPYWKSMQARTGHSVPLIGYNDSEDLIKRKNKKVIVKIPKPKYIRIKSLDLSNLKSKSNPGRLSLQGFKKGYKGIRYV